MGAGREMKREGGAAWSFHCCRALVDLFAGCHRTEFIEAAGRLKDCPVHDAQATIMQYLRPLLAPWDPNLALG